MQTPQLIDAAMPELPNGARAIAPADYGDTWQREHQRHIGSSDSAAVCGVSQYRQPRDIYDAKTGMIPADATVYMQRGHDFERPIALEYARRNDVQLIYPVAMYEGVEFNVTEATPDAMPVVSERRLAEFKLCHWRRAQQLGEDGSDEVFTDWLIQAQHTMWVTGFEVVDVFVCIDPHTYRNFVVERNDRIIKTIATSERAFWRHVVDGTPPALDYWHDTTAAFIEAIGLGPELLQPEVFEDEQLVDMASEYHTLGASIKALEKNRRAVRAQLLERLAGCRHAKLVGSTETFTVKQTEVAGTVVPEHTRDGYVRATISKAKAVVV